MPGAWNFGPSDWVLKKCKAGRPRYIYYIRIYQGHGAYAGYHVVSRFTSSVPMRDSPPLPGIANLTWRWFWIWECRTSMNEISWNIMKQTMVHLPSVSTLGNTMRNSTYSTNLYTTAPKPDKQTKAGHPRQGTQCLWKIPAYAIVRLHPGSPHLPSLGPLKRPDTNEAEACCGQLSQRFQLALRLRSLWNHGPWAVISHGHAWQDLEIEKFQKLVT